MRRKLRRYTVDFYDKSDPEPTPGNVVRHVSSKNIVLGYWRVVTARRVKVRVSRGENSRWLLGIDRLDGKPPEGVTFTVWDNPRKPRVDRFSPLL
jgi:hypothetical protein